MKDRLEEYIRNWVPSPLDSEVEEILDLFSPKSFKKGEFFKKPFTKGLEIAFIPEGAIRTIIYDDQGEETTFRIREKNVLLIDPIRLMDPNDSAPREAGAECLEDLSMLVCDFKPFEDLLMTNLALNVVVRKHATQQMIDIGRQQLLFLTGSASDRYNYIMEHHPSLIQKFPLRLIASMIGVTPTQLSRVRNKK
ncbi:Crp/Fnr family transcriptional regulator [bacterium SCSIO 12741]|nr:Crp/Fnr family transcriptional regulator [bacterium SCSIO 12741]